MDLALPLGELAPPKAVTERVRNAKNLSVPAAAGPLLQKGEARLQM